MSNARQRNALGCIYSVRARDAHNAALAARHHSIGAAAATLLLKRALIHLKRGPKRSISFARAAAISHDGAGLLASAILEAHGDFDGSKASLAACARRSASATKKLDASKRLIVLLFQQGDESGALELLRSLKRYRACINPVLLRGSVLRECTANDSISEAVAVLDDALPPVVAYRVRSRFHIFWREHKYRTGVLHEGRPAGYFSYASSLDALPHGLLGCTLSCVTAHARRAFPELMERARFLELWCHSRGTSSGHQLHFDTQNEGMSTSLNPLLSCVLYMSSAGTGTVLATHRQAETPHPSEIYAAVCRPRFNRLLIFEGDLLHGVLPQKPGQLERRVTIMVSFWSEEFRGPQRVNEIGAARSFPSAATSREGWVSELLSDDNLPSGAQDGTEAKKAELEGGDVPLWVPVGAATLQSLPSYDSCFQGC